MIPAKFSTANIAPCDQADAWHRWFWPVFDIRPKDSPDDRYFPARNEVWNLGGLIVSRIIAPAATAVRTRANLGQAPIDHWVLGCCRKGMTTIQTDRAIVKAATNKPYLWSLGEASYSTRTQVDRVQILLPRDRFPEIRSQIDALCGSILDGPSAAVLGEYLSALSRWLASVPPEAIPRIAASVHNMISACLVPNADNVERAEADMNGFHFDRVRRAVLMHLRSPSLGPGVLCKLVGISRSSLYRLFMYEGGIMCYIQRQRLLQAHAVLSDPLNRQTILAVSEDLCFSDASSFSRAFRREFGLSPSDVRAAAAGGNSLPPLSAPHEPTGARSFAMLLHADSLELPVPSTEPWGHPGGLRLGSGRFSSTPMNHDNGPQPVPPADLSGRGHICL